jgi:Flp pilus assembly protein TadD
VRPVALYHQALELDPINAEFNLDLGIYYYCAGRLADAEVSLRKAIELDPTGGDQHAVLGYVLLAEGKHDAGFEAIARETDEEARETIGLMRV